MGSKGRVKRGSGLRGCAMTGRRVCMSRMTDGVGRGVLRGCEGGTIRKPQMGRERLLGMRKAGSRAC